MNSPPSLDDAAIASKVAAPQHGPRPLPLFLNILVAQTEHDPVLRARALVGLQRYQTAKRPDRPAPPPVHATEGAARLLHFDTGHDDTRVPVVFVPSLINPPDVLDLSENSSMMRWLAGQGHDVFMVDWGRPSPADREMNLAEHVAQRLLPLLQSLKNRHPPIVVGYCLGGTLAAGVAANMAITALVTIAAPWNFAGFEDAARQDIARLWAEAKPICRQLGYVPMEVLQSGFWALDPLLVVTKYAAFGEMEEGSQATSAFMALEDWANAGPPLTYGAGCELFEALYERDSPGNGAWTVMDKFVRPQDLAIPTLAISSLTDRIVPAASAPALTEHWTLDMGHVGMIVGSRAQEKLWQPLSRWLFKQQGRC